jgi:predicted alpha/beta-hydrolase family hydrolase
MLSYPLHAAGKPDRPRIEHFPGIRVPVLFVSGTRDAMAGKTDLTRAANAVPGKVSFHWIDTADHGYRPLKASGRTAADVLAEVAATTVAWVAQLGG